MRRPAALVLRPRFGLTSPVRVAIATIAFVAYVLLFPSLFAARGNMAAVFVWIPVAAGGGILGLVGGLAAGLVGVLLDAALLATHRDDGRTLMFDVGAPMSLALVALGGATGYLRDVIVRSRAQSRELDARARALDIEVASRRRAEADLQRQSALLRLTVEHSIDVLAVLGADGRLRYVSPSIRRMTGAAPEDLIGRDGFSFVHPQDRDSAWALFRGAAEGVALRDAVEVRIADARDGWRSVEMVGAGLFENGERTGAVISLRDVTERRTAEQALRRAERHAAQTDKLRALGEMASGVAHDLSQSLTLIGGYAEAAQRSLERSSLEVDGLREALAIVNQAALDGGASLRRLLLFARAPTEAPPEIVDFAELLPDVARLTAPRWRDGAQVEGRAITMRIEVAGDPTIEGWPWRLREALTNLIFNAVDAMPVGGTIELIARRVGGEVELIVRDDGIGMTPEVQDRVFEPFFTTKGDRGSGLGLAQVFTIVEAHRGQVTLESTPGRGTAILITLPAADNPSRNRTVAIHDQEVLRTPVAPRQAQRLLAVDDEPEIAQLVAVLMQQRGHSVETASSVAEAIDCLERATFDAVITDLTLGSGPNGWDLARQIRARWPRSRVILSTGWGPQIDISEARAQGIEAIVSKPYRVADLARAIERD